MNKKTLAVICAASLSMNSFLWADTPASSSASADQEEAQAVTPSAPPPATGTTASSTPALSQDQIRSLVAPIALYPDELLSQILVASTYPLEIVQAYQWLQQNQNLKGQDLTTAAQKQSWDPSIQALVAFPDVLKRLNQDITWTTNLGNAFLAQQSMVMDTVQQLRANAEQKGKLASTDQVKVTNTTDNGHPVVDIEPASPDVVYVPDYDPAWVWGPAPEYYPYPYWYYPPAPAFGWCWWGPSIFIGGIFIGWHGWGGWGWHMGWYGRGVVLNNAFFVSNHFNAVRFNTVHGAAVWVHNPDHRLGVAYPNRALSQRFRPAARGAFNRPTVGQARAAFNRSAARVNAARSFDRVGGQRISPSGYSRSAFGGMGRGANVRAQSSRGHSSLGHARGGGHGGGSHGGGGGGWGGGGGGGGSHR